MFSLHNNSKTTTMTETAENDENKKQKHKSVATKMESDTCQQQEETEKSAQQENDEEEEEEGIMTTTTFASLGVCEPLCQAAAAIEWKFASLIQKQVLPAALAGKDIVGLAETGSGKTGAFCIPLLQELLENPVRGAVFGIVLAPTRELAFQIHEVVQALGQTIGATSICVVGGVDMATQSIALARNPHVVVATPGRLVDHLTNTKGFHLRKLRYLILDEADRMLSLDFEEELNQILDVIPDSTQGRRTMLFSATMTSKVQKLQRASLSDPVRIEVSTKFQTPSQLLQSYLFIPGTILLVHYDCRLYLRFYF
jgi:ATP-dependent RNA helicase DDX47/RRP3